MPKSTYKKSIILKNNNRELASNQWFTIKISLSKQDLWQPTKNDYLWCQPKNSNFLTVNHIGKQTKSGSTYLWKRFVDILVYIQVQVNSHRYSFLAHKTRIIRNWNYGATVIATTEWICLYFRSSSPLFMKQSNGYQIRWLYSFTCTSPPGRLEFN